MREIVHSLPSVGQITVRLFPPADELYAWLDRKREISRLNKLRHLGSLSQAHPGTRLARFDYTMAMLHFAGRLGALAGSNNFSLGGVSFSSPVAAIQTIGLAWNIGHLPGTFAVEKGVYRFIAEHGANDPVALLPIPHLDRPEVAQFRSTAKDYLIQRDFLSICRVLAVAKLADTATDNEFPYKYAFGFFWPLLSGHRVEPSPRWSKLYGLFTAVRHVSYLTLDCPFTGLQWLPQLPSLFDELARRNSDNWQGFLTDLSEVLAPVERSTFNAIYHSDAAREATAAVAQRTYERLGSVADAAAELRRWSRLGLIRDLRLRDVRQRRLMQVGCAKIRSHFHSEAVRESDFESELRAAGLGFPIASRYTPWTSSLTLEPSELILCHARGTTWRSWIDASTAAKYRTSCRARVSATQCAAVTARCSGRALRRAAGTYRCPIGKSQMFALSRNGLPHKEP
jgi:hypothetical protein